MSSPVKRPPPISMVRRKQLQAARMRSAAKEDDDATKVGSKRKGAATSDKEGAVPSPPKRAKIPSRTSSAAADVAPIPKLVIKLEKAQIQRFVESVFDNDVKRKAVYLTTAFDIDAPPARAPDAAVEVTAPQPPVWAPEGTVMASAVERHWIESSYTSADDLSAGPGFVRDLFAMRVRGGASSSVHPALEFFTDLDQNDQYLLVGGPESLPSVWQLMETYSKSDPVFAAAAPKLFYLVVKLVRWRGSRPVYLPWSWAAKNLELSVPLFLSMKLKFPAFDASNREIPWGGTAQTAAIAANEEKYGNFDEEFLPFASAVAQTFNLIRSNESDPDYAWTSVPRKHLEDTSVTPEQHLTLMSTVPGYSAKLEAAKNAKIASHSVNFGKFNAADRKALYIAHSFSMQCVTPSAKPSLDSSRTPRTHAAVALASIVSSVRGSASGSGSTALRCEMPGYPLREAMTRACPTAVKTGGDCVCNSSFFDPLPFFGPNDLTLS